MNAELLLRATFATYLLTALAALAIGGRAGRAVAAAGAALGASAGLVLGVTNSLSGASPAWSLPGVLAFGGLALRVDGLSAFFLVVIGAIGVAAAVYGFGYTAPDDGRPRLRVVGGVQAALLLAMTLTVTADNALTFLAGWELTSLAAYLLVLTDPAEPGAVRAANWYLAVTHAGFAALLAACLLLSDGVLSAPFEGLRHATLAAGVRDAVFLLALFGCGTKCGLVPLHVWLPMAHPVAPSHGSALMSGVVIKMGVYAFFRLVFDLLGPGPAWWGGVVLAAGGVSALLGVLYALMEHDLKRLLAYHSVENIGIIFMGFGGSLLLYAYGLPQLAVIGAIAGLYHTLNHAAFKGLLFLGAGSVLRATRTSNMEEMGGLIRSMPYTAFFFLVGAAAISALPPLNGFVSEWLVFQTLLAGVAIPRPEVALAMPFAVALLALTGGLAAACFVKAFGITFLAMPRSPEAAQAQEAPASMRAGMALLAVLCLVLGILPFVVTTPVARLANAIGHLHVDEPASLTAGLLVHLAPGSARMSPALLALLLAGAGLLTAAVVRVGASRRLRLGQTWGCGRIGQTPRMQYTASAFAEPLRRVFAEIYQPSHDLTIDTHPDSRYFVREIRYETAIHPWFERTLYGPLIRVLTALGARTRRLQTGLVHLYLLYLVVALIVLLVVSRWL